MAIKVVIESGADSGTARGLYQWDCGQVLEISAVDLGNMIGEVHFSCQGMSEAIAHSCSFSAGFGSVEIPNQCLEQSSTITAWIYEIIGSQGKTRKTISLPVVARPRPSVVHEIPSVIPNKYEQLITEVNEAVNALENGDVTAGKATYANTAGEAEKARTADIATEATHANSASYALTANIALRASNDGDGNKISDAYLKRGDRYQNYIRSANAPEMGTIAGGVISFKITSFDLAENTILGEANFIVDLQGEFQSPVVYLPFWYGGNLVKRMFFLRFVVARYATGEIVGDGNRYHIDLGYVEDTGDILFEQYNSSIEISYKHLSAPYVIG